MKLDRSNKNQGIKFEGTDLHLFDQKVTKTKGMTLNHAS
jgi:hypothetical protein